MGEVGHAHVWWHFYITDDGLVWDNPYEPVPDTYSEDGYACFCGASPPGGAP